MNENEGESTRSPRDEFDIAEFTRRFLVVLGVTVESPDLETLTALVRAFFWNIPFENISKLFYLKRYGLRTIPDAQRYLDGIETHHFGGTCYSNSYYFHLLLKSLDFETRLCGADMANPDAHLVIVVQLGGRDYLIDVGYAAPFLAPMPLDLEEDLVVAGLLDDRYLLKARVPGGQSRIELYRDGELKHGYGVNPKGRAFSEFQGTLERSFRSDASFLNSLLLARYSHQRLVRLNNFTLIDTARDSRNPIRLRDVDALVEAIEEHFGIAAAITREATEGIDFTGDVWT